MDQPNPPVQDLISPWHPTTNPQELKVALKLIEELGEAVSSMARTLMQGIDEVHPITSKPNRQWLEEEIADVYGNLELVIDWYKLDRFEIGKRAERKKQLLRIWHQGA